MAFKVIFRYNDALGAFVDVEGWHPGGGPIQIYHIATELAKDPQFEVSLWVDGHLGPMVADGVNIITQPTPVSNGIPFVSRSINRGRSEYIEREYSDGVFVFTTCDPVGFPAEQKRIQAHGGKTIYRVASDLDVAPELRSFEKETTFTTAMIDANAVITQTEWQKLQLMERYGKESAVVPSCFKDWTPLATRSQKDCILWVGIAFPYKRPWIVLELARHFRNEHFIMVMPPSSQILSDSLVDTAKVLGNVEIIEYVDWREIQHLFNRAKVVLNTSTIEGYPNTLHQAAIGKSPYLSLKWNADDYLVSSGMGLCSDNDINEMISQLGCLLDNPSETKRLGDSAYQFFNEHHEASVAVEQYKRVIRGLLIE